MTALRNWVARYPALQSIANLPRPMLMAIGAGVVAVIVASLLWMRGPAYAVLFSNMGDKDGGAIVSALEKMHIPHQFSANGSAILVPQTDVHAARMKLAEQGLPQGGNVGFELMENPHFGASQFAEQVTYQRAIEGELSRSVEAVYSVVRARVHLAIPKQTLFVRDRKSPTASVLLTLAPGRTLSDGQVAAIAYLVASSVPDLKAEDISIVDQTGRLLSARSSTGGLGVNDSHAKFTAEVEDRTAARVLSILTPIVGAGNVHTEVSAQIDFNQREQTSETYRPNRKPDLAAIRSEQTNDSTQNGTNPIRGVPGALTNQPPADSTAPLINPPAPLNNVDGATAGTNAANASAVANRGPSTQNRSATVNYEVDRTVSHVKESVGQIKRLSVAVVLNYRNGEDGKLAPLPAEQLEQIREIVREAIGLSAERGDSLRVANTPFTDSEIKSAVWQNPQLIEYAKETGKYLLFALLAFFLWSSIIRPMIRPKDAALDHNAVVPAEPGLTAEERARQSANRYQDNIDAVRKVAADDPRAVAMVLRGWMTNLEEN